MPRSGLNSNGWKGNHTRISAVRGRVPPAGKIIKGCHMFSGTSPAHRIVFMGCQLLLGWLLTSCMAQGGVNRTSPNLSLPQCRRMRSRSQKWFFLRPGGQGSEHGQGNLWLRLLLQVSLVQIAVPCVMICWWTGTATICRSLIIGVRQ